MENAPNAELKPINWKKNLLFIWISQILSISGFASVMPFIPIYIRDRWGIADEHELGVWMASFYFFGMLSFCVSTPVWGALADRYGRKLMLLRACYLDALLFPCFLLAPNPTILVVIRFIASAFTGTVSAAQTLIVTTTPEEHHGFALGALSSSVWSGNLVGFAAGGLLVHYFGFTVAFFGCGAMYLLAGLFAHIFVQENFQRPTAEGIRKSRFRFSSLSLPALMIFLLIAMTAVARRFDDPYVALMIEKIHGPENTAFHTGWISAMAAVGGVFSGILIGRFCDKYSAERVTLPTVLFAAGTMFWQAIAATLGLFAAGRFCCFLAAGGLEPAFFSILAKIAPKRLRGTYFGLAAALRMAGILLSSILSGGVIYLTGVRNIYTVGGLLFLIILPVFFYTVRILHRKT